MKNRLDGLIRKRLALVCATGSFLALGTAAFAQTSPTSPDTEAAAGEEGEVEVVRVTGTRLSGAAAEGTLSVSEYRMDTIETEGYSNFGEMLRRKLPQYGGGIGTVNDSFGNGGSGAATISLRNLPGSRTLVLLNGRRTSADLNLLPTTAIEKIEVLNDGASAVYGSEAIAGVVNIVLKKDFQGVEVGARYANTTETDISERRAHMVGGGQWGKLRATLGLEYHKANPQYSIDREVSTPAGDAVSGTSNPGLFSPRLVAGTDYDPATQDTVTLRWRINPDVTDGLTASSVIPAAFNPQAFLVFDRGTTTAAQRNAARDAEEARLNALLGASSPVVYGPNYTYFDGLQPGYPYGYYTFAVRPYERKNGYLNLDFEASENVTLFAEFLYSTNESTNWLAPSPLGGTVVPTTNYWFSQVFDNQVGQTRNYTFGYRPTELGPRITTNEFTQTRIVLGARGQVGAAWNWEVAYLDDENELYQIQSGGVLAGDYVAALAGTTAATAFNPFGFTPLYGSESPVNSPEFMAALSGSADASYFYYTKGVDVSLDGELFELPGGVMGLATGFEYRTERDKRAPSEALVNGDVFPFNGEPPFDAERSITSFYAEVGLPVLESLRFDVAARIEDYDDAGSTGIKPRISFKWEPVKDVLAIRGSFAQGFVAPSLFALKPGDQGQDFDEILNPVTGTRTQPEEGVLYVGNPDLAPAESDSFLIGAIYSPKSVKGLSVGMNYYRIEETGIPFASAQYIVDQWAAAGGDDATNNPFGPTASPSAQNPTGAQVETAPSGELYQVRNVGEINSGDRNTDGIDLFVAYEFKTGMGTFDISTNWTKVMSFEQEDFPGSGLVDYLDYYWGSGSVFGNYGFPELKGSTNLSWKNGSYSASIGHNYVDGYKEVENDLNQIPSYQTYDFRVGVQLPWFNTSILAGVNNITDEQPPYIATSFENGHDRAIADIRGRVWFIEAAMKF